MPIRPFALSTLLVAALTFSGCSTLPAPSTAADSVTPLQMDTRIGQMEQLVLEQCASQTRLLRAQAEKSQRILSGVTDNGVLLRGLRADVESLDESPQVINNCPAGADSPLDNKEIVGRIEWVGFPTIGTHLKARIDSGANTSSLSAKDITEFERNGENWVRFKLALENEDSFVASVNDQWIEAPVTRTVKILQASGSESRPVVSLLMTLGTIKQRVEFTLNDRTHLTYPVLLGRRFLMDLVIIDVSRTYVQPRPEFSGGPRIDATAQDDAAIDDAETR
ncbi:ATP-dependent zinc protease family protein [Halomonas sp. WWR20]